MRVLVIGASGFLGGHIRLAMDAAGVDVTTTSRAVVSDSSHQQVLDLASDSQQRIIDTLATTAADVVVNCAGATSGSPELMAATNICGIYALTTAMLVSGFAGRLIHLGSGAEYGRTAVGSSVSELQFPQPVAVYGATKLAGTLLVQQAATAGLDAVVLRVFNPVGPRSPEENLAGRLARELRRALNEGTEVRIGSLNAVRDFVDVRDVADAVVAAAMAPVLAHPVLNIGSGVGVPVRTLVEKLVEISGWSSSLVVDEAGSTRSADVPWQQGDISRARDDLAWQPNRSLQVSLTDLWNVTV